MTQFHLVIVPIVILITLNPNYLTPKQIKLFFKHGFASTSLKIKQFLLYPILHRRGRGLFAPLPM